MGRRTIFAKGNLDVRDTLHCLRLGGEVAWNGLGQVLRERGAPVTVRVRHEVMTRTDAVLAAGGAIPPDLAARPLPLGFHTLAAQFSRALFDAEADAYVLSIQPDIWIRLLRRRRGGDLVFPPEIADLQEADRDWLMAEFERLPLLTPEQSMAGFEAIIERLRARSDAPILIFNQSAAAPGERIHCHVGMEAAQSTRIRRFNLALIELSQRTGISIVDVDTIVANGGAERLKLDALHFTPEGCRRVAEAVADILADYGLFDEA